MFEIRQSGDQWEIVDTDGNRVGEPHATYALAVTFLGGMLAMADLAEGATTADGLLPEPWTSDPAIAFSEDTGDGRDFTACLWTARDPNVSTLPLMLQTETQPGHMSAELAGFFTEVTDLGQGTSPGAAGRFYDNEAGRTFRDMLLDGRSFGVSVDPGSFDAEWECVEEDEDGFCIADRATFAAYEIIGVTGTPFPAFAAAAIRLEGADEMTDEEPEEEPVAASAAGTATSVALLERPPAAWFTTAEPAMGQPFEFGDLGEEWLVDQGDGRVAMPLTITADGRVAGHLAVWGTCHVGFPGQCITPPQSAGAYAHFHVGEVHTAEGNRVAVGALTASCDHAIAAMRAPEATDHYAHNGIAWANVRVSNGEHGPWVAGALRPDVTAAQVAVLRAGALSGDWRRIGGRLELVAALAVTTPGFPIAREALVASGLRVPPAPLVQSAVEDGEQVSLIASGLVRRCPDCARRAAASSSHRETAEPASDMDHVKAQLAVLERRTRHLVPAAALHAASAARFRAQMVRASRQS